MTRTKPFKRATGAGLGRSVSFGFLCSFLFVGAGVVSGVVLGEGVASAKPAVSKRPMIPEAQGHYDAGLKLYGEGDFPKAVEELLAADHLDSRPEVLYALGQATRKLGDCRRAIFFFSAYAEVAPTPQAASAARLQINRCLAEVSSTPLPTTKPADKPVEPAPQPVPVEAKPEVTVVKKPAGRSVARDPLAGALLGVGLGVCGAGGGLLGWSESLFGNAGSSLHAYESAKSAGGIRIGGFVLLGVGGAAIVGSIVRYAILARHSRAH